MGQLEDAVGDEGEGKYEEDIISLVNCYNFFFIFCVMAGCVFLNFRLWRHAV
jgi:hypothetical protein